MDSNSFGIPRREHRFLDCMALTNLLYILVIESGGGTIQRELVNETLAKHNGLRAMLALNGFPISRLTDIVNLARTCDDKYLRKTLNYRNWDFASAENNNRIWGQSDIQRLTVENGAFRQGIVNLLYEGGSLTVLHNNFPPREIKRLSIQRMSFKPTAMIEALVEYGLYYEQVHEVSTTLETLSKQLEY